MPIQSINTSAINNTLVQSQNNTKINNDTISFKDLLDNAINNVVTTDEAAQIDAVKIASGDIDDLHTLAIDIAKADLVLQLLIGVRNKALDAYNEIMRITM